MSETSVTEILAFLAKTDVFCLIKINSIVHSHPQVSTHLWKQLFSDWLVLCVKQSNIN